MSGEQPYVGEDPPRGSVPPPQRYEASPPATGDDLSIRESDHPSGLPEPVPPPSPTGAVAPPAPSTDPAPASDSAPAPAAGSPGRSDLGKRILAISGPLSFICFMAAGFMGGWAWSWLFLFVPGVVYAWVNATDDD